METDVRVLRVDKFMSKKGNPCLWVHIAEKDQLPCRILIFSKEQVENPPLPGSTAKLYSDFDGSMVACLKLRW